MLPWDKFFEEKIREIAKRHYILDIGGGFKLQKGLDRYRGLFNNTTYKVLDKNRIYTPDIVGDVQNMPEVESDSVDAIICKAVLEHVEDPISAVKEMRRVLKPGGVCLVYVPFLYAYHARKGVYGDFYRYTLEGLKWLFRDFSNFEYSPVRGRLETIVYLLPVKLLRKSLSPIARFFDRFRPSENQASGYNIFVTK